MGSVMDQPRPWEKDYYKDEASWKKSPYYREEKKKCPHCGEEKK